MARRATAMKLQDRSIALGDVRADYGPAIRRQAIRALDGSLLREADVEKHEGPDPDKPDSQFNVSRGIRWLPLKLQKAKHIDKYQLAVAEAYRRQLDLASGIMGMDTMMPSMGGAGSWSTIDVQISASRLLEHADLAMGRENARVIRLAVSADTASEVALVLGIDRKRVPVVIEAALTDLLTWGGMNVKSAH